MEENEKRVNRETPVDEEALRRRKRRAMLKKKRQRQIQRNRRIAAAGAILLAFLIVFLIVRAVGGRAKQQAEQPVQTEQTGQAEAVQAVQTDQAGQTEQPGQTGQTGQAEQPVKTEQTGQTGQAEQLAQTTDQTGQTAQTTEPASDKGGSTGTTETTEASNPADTGDPSAGTSETAWTPAGAEPGSEEQIDVSTDVQPEVQTSAQGTPSGTPAGTANGTSNGTTTGTSAGSQEASAGPQGTTAGPQGASPGGPGSENQLSEEVASFHPGYKFTSTDSTETIESDAVQSSYALIVDVDSGTIVAGRGHEEQISPASMTKILTLLVGVEHLTDSQIANMENETFTITEDIFTRVYYADSSVAGWYPDDEPTLEDLLYGIILPSGADAAVALAEYTAGSEEVFVGWMNDKLKELGISDTAHFTNCIGLYDEDHYCTLTDMAAIMKAAIENDLCREVLSAHTYTTSPTENAPDGIALSNWFLRRIEDKETNGEVVGAKTGFVKEAGNCAASYQVSDSGGHYICVTANAWSAWRCIYDHVEIYTTYTE